MNPTLSDKAAYAIDGLPPSIIANKVKAMENLFINTPRWRDPLGKDRERILRSMIQALALEVAVLMNYSTSQDNQAASADNFIKTIGSPSLQREMLMFIRERYPQIAHKLNDGQPMLSVVKELLEARPA